MENTHSAKSKTTSRRITIGKITKIGVLAALASVLMVGPKFPLPFAPSFYKLEFSEVITLIGGFALGPIAAILIDGIKVLVNFFLDGTTTFGIGELANFIIGCSFVVPAAIIYKRRKTGKSAAIGMAVSFFSIVIVSALVNYFILIPAFVSFGGWPLDAVIGAGTSINANITDVLSLILFATVPFNATKGAACILLTSLIYKRVSPLLKRGI